MTAAEKMEMEMEDGLARPAAIVYDGAGSLPEDCARGQAARRPRCSLPRTA